MAADSEDCFRSIEVFWTKDVTDTEDSNVAYVPGIMEPGNRRPTKITARKTREVKAAIPRKQPKVEDLPISGSEPPMRDKVKTRNANNSNNSSNGNNSKDVDLADKCRKASLKDLCNEDKKRIADLIRELARVGDEKEGVVKQLHQERHQFEKHIGDVLGQQEALLKERESVQSQLLACQALLLRYQELVSEQHDRASIVSSEATSKRTADKAVNSSFTLSSPRSDCAASERKADLYPPKTPPRPATVKSHDVVHDARHMVESSSQHQPPYYDEPPDPSLHSVNHQPYTCQQVAPPFMSAPLVAPDPTDGRLMPPPQHTCYCPYHALGHLHTLPTQTCYTSCTAPPSGDVRHHGGDAQSKQQRPFTKVIDEEIAKEKHSSRPALAEDHLVGIGPLSVPAMSSTQRSDYGSVITGTTSSAEFVPLQPESVRSSMQDVMQDCVPGGTTGLPESLTEDEFIRYYQQLTPAERKRQLQTQKAALLKEQQYLRKVLAEQEQLLTSKQEQLHKQQSVQRQRLEYFEQNGHFPGLPLGGSTISADNGAGSSCSLPVAREQEDEVTDLMRQRLEELRLHKHVVPPGTSFRNLKSASAEMYPSGKRSSVTSPLVRRTVSVATSPIRSADLGREQVKRQTQHTAHDSTACSGKLRSSLKTKKKGPTRPGVPPRVTPRELSISLPVCDDSVTSLLDIVDEVESLHNYSHNSNSAPKQQSWSLAEISLSAKPTVGSWSESDSLEESRVLEDVFFVK